MACEDNRAPRQTLSPQLLTGYDTPDDLDQNAATMTDHDSKGAATAASGGAGGAPAATPAMGFGSQLRVFGYAFPEEALEDLRGSVQTLRSNAQLYKDMPAEIRKQVDAVVAGDSARNVADELAAAAPEPATNESASRLVEQLQGVQAELREAEELRDEVEAERDRVEGFIADTEGQVTARQKEAQEMVGERVSLARQALEADTAVQEATRKLDEARKGGSDAEVRMATRALKKAEFGHRTLVLPSSRTRKGSTPSRWNIRAMARCTP